MLAESFLFLQRKALVIEALIKLELAKHISQNLLWEILLYLILSLGLLLMLFNLNVIRRFWTGKKHFSHIGSKFEVKRTRNDWYSSSIHWAKGYDMFCSNSNGRHIKYYALSLSIFIRAILSFVDSSFGLMR